MTEVTQVNPVAEVVATEEVTKQVSIADFLLEDMSQLEDRAEISFPQFKAPFIVRSIGAEAFANIRKQATVKRRSKTGQIVADTDQDRFTDLLVEASVVQPDLHNAQLQSHYGTIGQPVATAKKMLKAGQFADLQEKIIAINGFDQEETINDLVDTVKK